MDRILLLLGILTIFSGIGCVKKHSENSKLSKTTSVKNCEEVIPDWWKNNPQNPGKPLNLLNISQYLAFYPDEDPRQCKNLESFLDQLLKTGGPVDRQDKLGRTALMNEVLYHDEKTPSRFLNWLIKNGANPNHTDENGVTPLHWSSNYETTKWLIDHGAQVNRKDNLKITPLMARCGSARMTVKEAQLLLEHGADLNAKDKNGETAFLYLTREMATPSEPVQLLKFFASKGANIHVTNNTGKNALIYSVWTNESLNILKTLIELGLDVNSQDKEGKTVVFELVKKFGRHYEGERDDEVSKIFKESLSTLQKAKHNFKLEDKKGFTAYNYAMREHYLHTAQLLKKLESQ